MAIHPYPTMIMLNLLLLSSIHAQVPDFMTNLIDVEEVQGDRAGPHMIKGKLNMNGQIYSTLCDCSGNDQSQASKEVNKAQCDP